MNEEIETVELHKGDDSVVVNVGSPAEDEYSAQGFKPKKSRTKKKTEATDDRGSDSGGATSDDGSSGNSFLKSGAARR